MGFLSDESKRFNKSEVLQKFSQLPECDKYLVDDAVMNAFNPSRSQSSIKGGLDPLLRGHYNGDWRVPDEDLRFLERQLDYFMKPENLERLRKNQSERIANGKASGVLSSQGVCEAGEDIGPTSWLGIKPSGQGKIIS